jgi:hypothetical protein
LKGAVLRVKARLRASRITTKYACNSWFNRYRERTKAESSPKK